MTISLVGTFGNGTSSGNLNVTLPTGISQGNAIGAVGICSTGMTLTPPAGWSVRAGFPADGGNARMYAWTKDAVTAGDSGTVVTFITSASNKFIVAGFVLGSGNGFPADWTDDLTFQAHSTTSTSYTAPASTSTVDNTWGVAAFGVRGTDPTAWTPAGGLTERQDLQRVGTGATSLHLCDSNGTIGPSSTTWGPFTETNINIGNGGGLTWLIKENASGGGGGGGGGGGVNYPKLGLWRQRDGTTWTQDTAAATAIYGEFQGHWTQYYGVGELPVGADVETAFDAGHDIHIFWKAYDTSWADTAAGNYDTELDAVAADVIALCSGTGRKLWLTVHHEPEDDYIDHGSGGTGWTAANYRGMWSRVRSRFDAAGASQYVTWVLVWQNSHSHPAEMLTLYGNDGTMDDLVDVVSQQDYIGAGNQPSLIATKWIEDLEFLVDNDDTGRHWSYLHKPQAFTEWGADLGGAGRGTATHRAQTIDAIRGILPDLASRNVVGITYFDARTHVIDDPPSVDGIAFQNLKDATEAGQGSGPVAASGVSLARDGATTTSSTIAFTLPTGWAQGDYAIVWLSTNSVPDVTTAPAEWTLAEGPVTGVANDQRGWRYTKFLVAGEPDPSWVISQGVRPCGVMVVLRGMDTDAPEDAQAALTATASSTSHAAASVTTSEDESYLLTAWLFRWADASGNGGVNYGTPPGTHTTLGSASVNSGANPGAGILVAALTANPVTPGSYGSYTATVPVTSTGICGQVAVTAAADVPTPPDTEFGAAVGHVTVVGVAVGETTPATAPTGRVPDTSVLVAFASQPMDPSPVFTTLPRTGTGSPDDLTIVHGRADEFTDVTAGTCDGPLNNADGRYTLGKTDGPYGANVKIGKRVRVQYLYQGGLYVRHDGHANSWPTTWPTGRGTYAASGLSSTDRLKRLGQIGELRSILEEETLRDAPACYYPLGEGDNATSAGSITTTPTAAAVDWPLGVGGGSIQFGEGTGPGTDSLSAAIFAPQSQTSGRHLRALPVSVASGSPGGLTLSCWFNTTATPSPNSMVLCALTTTAGDDAVILAIHTTTGQAHTFVVHDGQGAFGNVSPKAYNDGRTHHAAVTLSRSSGGVVTVRLYVDGAQVQSGTYDRGLLGTFDELDIGGWHVTDYWAPFSGTLSHVAAFGTALPVARIINQYQAGASGLAGERTDQRIARVADWIGLPAPERALDIGDKRMGPQSTAGQQPLQVMQEAANVEQGVLFISPDGKLTFHRLSRRYNVAAPELTLNCAAGHIQLGLLLPGDDFGVVNDLTVTRAGGAAQRAINQDSIDDYGLYRESLEVPAYADSDAQAVGNWRVGHWGTPRARIPNLTISLSRLHGVSPSLVQSILALRISSLIRLTNLPTQAPGTSVDVFVEGWTEHISTAGEWTITLNCSPADGFTVAVVDSAVVNTSQVAL